MARNSLKDRHAPIRGPHGDVREDDNKAADTKLR